MDNARRNPIEAAVSGSPIDWRPTCYKTVSDWVVLYGLIDDSPGEVINLKTREHKPIPPRLVDVMKTVVIYRDSMTIRGQTGVETRRAALKSIQQMVQKELNGLAVK